MNQVLLKLITLSAILWATPAACQTVIGEFSPLPMLQGPTSMEITRVNFTCGPVRASVIALSGNVNVNNSTIGGTLFAQGGLTASNSSFASQLACNSSTLSVVVLGNLDARSSVVECGSVLVGGTVISAPALESPGATIRTENASQLFNTFLEGSTGSDLTPQTLETTLQEGSTISSTAVPATLNSSQIAFSSLSKEPAEDGFLPVIAFSVPLSILNRAKAFNLEISNPNTLVLIQVKQDINSTNLHLANFSFNIVRVPPSFIILDMSFITSIQITNSQLQGALFAPKANLTMSNSSIEGTLIANSITIDNSEISLFPTNGTLCVGLSGMHTPQTVTFGGLSLAFNNLAESSGSSNFFTRIFGF